MSTNQLSVQNPDISTALVPYIVGGQTTNFTIDVSAANLLQDTTVKDFVVVSLTNNLVLENQHFNKLSPNSIQYVGPDRMVGEQLEVQRRTPAERYQFIRYKALFDSAIYNQEIERLWRRLLDAELVGIGPGSGVSNAPTDEDFGPGWSNDVFRSRVAKNLYDKFVLVDADIAANNAYISGVDSGLSTLNNNFSSLANNAALKNASNVFSQSNTFDDAVRFNDVVNFYSTTNIRSGVSLQLLSGSTLSVSGSVGFNSSSSTSVAGTWTFGSKCRFTNGINQSGGVADLRNIRNTGYIYTNDLEVTGPAGSSRVLRIGPGNVQSGVITGSHGHSIFYWDDTATAAVWERRMLNDSYQCGMMLNNENRLRVDAPIACVQGRLDITKSSGWRDIFFGRAYSGGSTNPGHSYAKIAHADGVLSLGNYNGGSGVRSLLYMSNNRIDITGGTNWKEFWTDSIIRFGWTGSGLNVMVDSSDIGSVQFIAPSDARAKEQVKVLKNRKSLDTLLALKPVSFRYKGEDKRDIFGHYDQYGLIAQEVLDVVPDIVRANNLRQENIPEQVQGNKPTKYPPGQLKQIAEDDNTLLHVEYMQLIPLLVSALQQLHEEVQALRNSRPNNP